MKLEKSVQVTTPPPVSGVTAQRAPRTREGPHLRSSSLVPAAPSIHMRTVGFLLVAILHVFAVSSTGSSGKHIAIIVHPDNELNGLSASELRQIFRLNRQRWANGQKVYLVMQEEGSDGKKIVLEKVYQMTSDQLKRFWLGKINSGDLTGFPKTLRTDESVRLFISRVPNAIGYVDASHPKDHVKVLRLDGKLPGENGYMLVSDR